MFNPAESEFPILQNRLVTFEIQIANQGTVDATEIELTDYIPAGLTLEDPDWTASNGTAVYNQLMNIAAGQTSSVMITFRVDTGISGQLINETEISDAKDEFGAEVEDIDSTPDSDVANDTGGEVNTPDDNNLSLIHI